MANRNDRGIGERSADTMRMVRDRGINRSDKVYFLSGEYLLVVKKKIGKGEEHWDSPGSGNPLLDTSGINQNKYLSKNFQVKEFAMNQLEARIDVKLIEALQKIRDNVNSPIKIISGYRSYLYNKNLYDGYIRKWEEMKSKGKKVGEKPKWTEQSRHIAGSAVDFNIEGMNGKELAEKVIDILGCGKYGIGLGKDYIHFDVFRDRFAVWPYSKVPDSWKSEINSYYNKCKTSILKRYNSILGSDTSSNSSKWGNAIKMNHNFSNTLGWNKYFDEINDLLLPLSGLKNISLSEEDFANAVSRWQMQSGFIGKDVDGVIGPNTWKKMQLQLRLSLASQVKLQGPCRNGLKFFPDVFSFIPEVANIMDALKLTQSAAFQRLWLSKPANTIIKRDSIFGTNGVLDIHRVRMDWVLKYERARNVYSEIRNQDVLLNTPAKNILIPRIIEKFRDSVIPEIQFGSYPAGIDREKEYINFRSLSNFDAAWDGLDDLNASIGLFTFKIIPKGRAYLAKGNTIVVDIYETGVYLHDSFDFEEDQELGGWQLPNKLKIQNYYRKGKGVSYSLVDMKSFCSDKMVFISNMVYRGYRDMYNVGADFIVYSDIKRENITAGFRFLAPQWIINKFVNYQYDDGWFDTHN